MLKIEHLKKSYENFSLDCSLEVKKGHVTVNCPLCQGHFELV